MTPDWGEAPPPSKSWQLPCGCSDRELCDAHYMLVLGRAARRRENEKQERLLLMQLSLPENWAEPVHVDHVLETLYDLAHSYPTLDREQRWADVEDGNQ
jgi:hypothetical protein